MASFYTWRTQQLAAASYEIWQRSSSTAAGQFYSRGRPRTNYSGGTEARAAANQQALSAYLEELVPATALSPNIAHIPDEHPVSVDVSDPEKQWTNVYSQAKNSLRPQVKYQWKSNATQKSAAVITLSEQHVDNLKDNFDFLIWYRNELQTSTSENNWRGTENFEQFLDYFVTDLLEGLPSAPQIDMATGSVDAGAWELDERKLREQLIMAYRYLIAKYQVYGEYEQFGAADRELLISMMKLAFLVGAT